MKNSEQGGAVNPHAFGTFVTHPACAGDHAKSEWGYLTGDVSEEYEPCAIPAPRLGQMARS